MRGGHFSQIYKTSGLASGNASKLVQSAPLSNVPFETYDIKPDDCMGFPHLFFSALCDFFALFLSARAPFQFYDVLQQTLVSKSQKGPAYTIFGIVSIFKTFIFCLKCWFSHFSKTLCFLSLRYGADFRLLVCKMFFTFC